MQRIFRIFAPLVFIALPVLAQAVELVMVERQGCHYCIEWKADLGPIYPNTAAGQYAPLRVIDIAEDVPADLNFARKVVFTPTFILVEEGREIGRIEGYPGEDFFWGLLEMMLKSKTDFGGGS
ncbi:hypothetical protein TG4357_02428 [Thalassovita gelatinovora]|uniref:Thioredoxin-related protein n=1 Tax=Thalassovita gelatinovora TaxID=53501 RepID=A0A0P1G0P4_THAGE|nr:hypothetical protein [Thalassovita gelatinovora]QIZ79930.1 thioredoxin family protein [Thalassovita gelatinovora]CUH66445.1 hypothetical protein TG4357_02428 [Thalassovita gelatinovora]SER13912.1 Thioredoxin-related protein [Thalassovita gelatinovora]